MYLTGIWLDRALDVSVSGASLNFTVWLNGVDSAMSVMSSPAVVGMAGGSSGMEAGASGHTRQQPHRHHFHVMQSGRTVDTCDGTTAACFPNIALQGRDNSVLSFTAPVFNLTRYLPLVITYNSSVDEAVNTVHNSSYSALTNWTGSDWMYYTPVECDTGMIVGLLLRAVSDWRLLSGRRSSVAAARLLVVQ